MTRRDLTISELTLRKKALERDLEREIARLCGGFQDETGVEITSLDARFVNVGTIDEPARSAVERVAVGLHIGGGI